MTKKKMQPQGHTLFTRAGITAPMDAWLHAGFSIGYDNTADDNCVVSADRYPRGECLADQDLYDASRKTGDNGIKALSFLAVEIGRPAYRAARTEGGAADRT